MSGFGQQEDSLKFLMFLIVILSGALGFGQDQPLFPGDNARFVSDVTFPDGSIVKVGAKITKTWRIRNRGMVEWKDRELRIEGDAQGFKLAKAHPFSAASATDVDISVDLVVPKKKGHYRVLFKQWVKVDNEWKLALPNKQGVYLDINVK